MNHSGELKSNCPIQWKTRGCRYYHDKKSSVHLGLSKTMSSIRQGYYLPGSKSDVWLYIAGCDEKGVIKTRQTSANAKKHRHAWMQMERVAADILGELHSTEKENRFLTIIPSERKAFQRRTCKVKPLPRELWNTLFWDLGFGMQFIQIKAHSLYIKMSESFYG